MLSNAAAAGRGRLAGGGSYSTATGGISVNFEPGYVPCGCLG